MRNLTAKILVFVAFTLLITDSASVYAQRYLDGPIQLQVRVREIKTSFDATDAFIGLTDPDELTYYVYAIDDIPISGQPWGTSNCLTDNFNPSAAGTPSRDFNTLIFNYTYTNAAVPQYVDLYLEAWEDDSDDITCSGSRCQYDQTVSCAAGAFTTSDDYYCFTSGIPFKNNLNYRNGNPCETYSHGYVTMDAGACSNNVYAPRIETFWRYTKGTACNGTDAINLYSFSSGSAVTHFNSNSCYGNTYAATGGKDVYYMFNTTAPIGANISVCGAANFDTYLTLLDSNCQPLASDDNGCGQTSVIDYPICNPGTYYVVVSGANAGDQGTFTLTISENASIIMNIATTATDVTCFGGNNGTATVNITGGQAPYTINWSPGVHPGNPTTITNLTAGTYMVTVTDSFGCSIIETATVNQPAQIVASVVNQVNPTCNGLNDGSIEMTTTGGLPPYVYSINLGNTYQNNSTFTGLGGGTYTVIAQDANGCADTVSNITLVTPPPSIIPNEVISNISCFGQTDGSVSFSPTGGVTPYTYSLNGGAFVSTSSFTGLPAGPVNVTIKDGLGCQVDIAFTITQPAPLTALITSTSDVSCNGSNDGSFTVTANGGTPGYQYSSDNGGSYQASNNFTGLGAGIYVVVVKDTNNCTVSTTVTINEPSQVVAAELFTLDVTCNGSADGVAVIAASGGNSPYQYSDDNITFQNNAAFDNLSGGTYTFYVKDNSGCTDSVSITIDEPAVIGATATITDATCGGISDGEIVVNATGGTQPYSYALNAGLFQSDSTFSGLSSGTYTVTVRDVNFCEDNFQFTVNDANTLGFTLNLQTNVGCYGASTGAISVTGTGGATPYQYALNGGSFQSSGSFTGLSAGSYTITVMDNNTCQKDTTIVITERPELVLTANVTDASCFNVSDGAIDLTVTGGTPPYSYSWDNGLPTQEDQTGLSGGTYTVVVTDDSSCTATLTVTVDQSPEIFLSIANVDDVTCNGAMDGGIDLTVAGGTPPFTFAWSDAANTTTEDLTNVAGGTYTVSVTDANGCSTTAFGTVGEATALTVSISSTDVTCSGGTDGSLSVSASGGTGSYTYALNGGGSQTDSIFTGLVPGSYFVVVTDAAGCSATTAFADVLDKDAIVLTYEDIEITQGESGQLVPDLTPSTLNIATISWSPTTGLSCTDCLDPIANPEQTTEYTVTITDVDGCTAQATVTVTVNQDFRVLVPNIFTPNGDGQNDQFQFYSFGAVKTEVSIFNRWGAQVYFNPNQESAAPGWDGTFKGDPAPEATYVYMINVVFANGEKRQVTGSVTLIR